MLNSIEVLWFTHVNGRVQFRALFRQFTNIFCYAQKRCARGDTAPLTQFKSGLYKYYQLAVKNVFDVDDPRTWKSICLSCNKCCNLSCEISCCY